MLAITRLAVAHPGGHGHSGHGNERAWRFADQTVATEGSFLLTKENKVFVEMDGQVVSLPINELSDEDQLYVQQKIHAINELNKANTTLTHEKHPGQLPAWKVLLLFSMLIGVLIVFTFDRKVRSPWKLSRRSLTAVTLLGLLMIAVGCSSDDPIQDIEDQVDELISAVTDPSSIDAAFEPYKHLVSTRWDDDYFYVESSGIPDHQMMVGITAWIAQVPVPQPYTGQNAWQIPLNTKFAANPASIEGEVRRGAIGIASNGIPIFNPINASGLISKDIGELDAFGGHSGRGDDYHYHTAPLHLENTSGTKPIAYVLDGYPVYGSLEPDGTPMQALDDTFHGHVWTDGSFHYHGTGTYPFMVSSLRGEVTLEGSSPDSQIAPQPPGMAFRGDPHPINSDDLIITALTQNSNKNGYLLEYTSQGKNGSVEYSWDENDFFTFIFRDIDGSVTTETFQR